MKLTQILALWQSIILLQNGRSSASKVECIKPDPDPLSPSSACHTLNEIVECSECYIQNGTYIQLLPGVHHINPTKGHSITIENIHSFVLTGDKEGTFIVCPEDFHFMFTLTEDMVISNLTFSFCELSFSNYKGNLTIARVNITDGRLLLLIVLYIFDCKVIDNNYAMICNDFKLKNSCQNHQKVYMSAVSLQRSMMTAYTQEHHFFTGFIGSCIKLMMCTCHALS